MAKYKLTNKAVADHNRIWENIVEEWSEQQTNKYYYQILESCQDIANNPELGKN